MEWTDRIVIVTGASSGIGEATARAVHARGARPVLAARRTDRIEKLAAELPGSVAVTSDVTTADGVAAILDAAPDGRVDVLVNNAGQGLHLPLADVDLDDLRAILELNVVAPLAMLQAVLPAMRAQGSGWIVNVSSGTTRMVLPGVGAYAATKAALNMLSDVARTELAGDGIVVSTIFPTITTTEFHETLRAGGMAGGPPPGVPVQTAEQVADAIVELIESGDAAKILGGRPPS